MLSRHFSSYYFAFSIYAFNAVLFPSILNLLPFLITGDSLVVSVSSDPAEDILVGQTLKHPFLTHELVEEQPVGLSSEHARSPIISPKDVSGQSNFLFLSLAEVNMKVFYFIAYVEHVNHVFLLEVQEATSHWRLYLVLPVDFITLHSQQLALRILYPLEGFLLAIYY